MAVYEADRRKQLDRLSHAELLTMAQKRGMSEHTNSATRRMLLVELHVTWEIEKGFILEDSQRKLTLAERRAYLLDNQGIAYTIAEHGVTRSDLTKHMDITNIVNAVLDYEKRIGKIAPDPVSVVYPNPPQPRDTRPVRKLSTEEARQAGLLPMPTEDKGSNHELLYSLSKRVYQLEQSRNAVLNSITSILEKMTKTLDSVTQRLELMDFTMKRATKKVKRG